MLSRIYKDIRGIILRTVCGFSEYGLSTHIYIYIYIFHGLAMISYKYQTIFV